MFLSEDVHLGRDRTVKRCPWLRHWSRNVKWNSILIYFGLTFCPQGWEQMTRKIIIASGFTENNVARENQSVWFWVVVGVTPSSLLPSTLLPSYPPASASIKNMIQPCFMTQFIVSFFESRNICILSVLSVFVGFCPVSRPLLEKPSGVNATINTCSFQAHEGSS